MVFSFVCEAKKRDVVLEIEVLLDGKKPLPLAHVHIVNLIPNFIGMPNVEQVGVRSTDKNGKISYSINNVNGKSALDITVLRDYCDWDSDYQIIKLKEEKSNIIKIKLEPQSVSCD